MESEMALDSCFDAFSLREPVSTSLENALDDMLVNRSSADNSANDAAGKAGLVERRVLAL